MKYEIADLKKDIENNLGLSSDYYELVLQPYVRNFIDNLNQTDSEKFSLEILNWNEDVLYHLADEILFSKNEYLDKDYLYCSIFLKTNNNENLDYLTQYLFNCLDDLNFEKIPLDFFLEMKEKMRDFYIQKNKENIDNFIRPVNDIINEKIKNK